VTSDRLTLAADGRVVLRLRHPWADGTTHLRFEPTAFLERLAVLVPRPRVNLLLYYGVLAPHAAWRAEVVPATGAEVEASGTAGEPEAGGVGAPTPAGRRWADLMRRAFDEDVLACPRCGGRLRLLALLEAGAVTARIRAAPGAAGGGSAGAPGAGAAAPGRRRALVICAPSSVWPGSTGTPHTGTGRARVRVGRRPMLTPSAGPCAGYPPGR